MALQGPELPEIPVRLKPVKHYLTIASTYDQRSVVISYWCRLYALQTGFKLTTKTVEERNFLIKLMDWLEQTKKEMHENEAITNETVAQAFIENLALKLFSYADEKDKAEDFGKPVIQAFYNAGLLYDILTLFGEPGEDAIRNGKYAKWKATYIHKCLKNGETPIPGPIKDENDELDIDFMREDNEEESGNTDPFAQPTPTPRGNTNRQDSQSKQSDSSGNVSPTVSQAGGPLAPASSSEEYKASVKTEGGATLSMEQMAKAQKFVKWAGSALNYDDVSTAVVNLRKALHLLTTGQDPA